ncbi:zinc-regulated transporter 1 [Nannizzia gypsea CBS 118893]|uniref:Zinc-regulated transporter 1 n=1 Tax=Arthroderma gypseum (strain ATCC MYA-4604 / CBS 118893) TaxID=535722 RepID=E4USE2_ARTGP|nr:zinc-regulated transporter 1 [Nannizzia gypsea CBS 118893]EFR00509.1 zinc-regulated transporter 1 [Nannizzia gypsea CBS 118893]
MNCPSRTDEDLVHPDWNQNPPLLPSDLTKREDLNGRVNDRQHRDGRDLSSSSLASPGGAFESCEVTVDTTPSLANLPLADAKLARYRDEFCSATKETPSTVHGLTASWIHPIKQWFMLYQGHIWWMMATVAATFVVYRVAAMFRTPASSKLPMQKSKRGSTCESGGVNRAEYNLPLHVIALFIIFFVSSFACGFPMLALKFPRLHIPQSFLFAVRHFGTGVLIATAFVHLLPTAFISLGNPCLSGFWTSDYPAMPGAIALAAVFFVAVIEMVFSPAQHVCSGNKDMERIVCRDVPSNEQKATSDDSKLMNTPDEISRSLSRHNKEPQVEGGPETRVQLDRTLPQHAADVEHAEEGSDGTFTPIVLSPEQKRQKAFMQCILLEIGILFHSVFIGMALSVTVGNTFIVLLIAIAFHQSFEGLALGSRIAALDWEQGAIQPWLMAMAYGCTTPIGQALGLATHTLYSPDSEVGLIMVGTMNALSSGLLVYASLVELLAEDFLSDESWRTLHGKRRVYACILVFLGAFGMSLVGAWA